MDYRNNVFIFGYRHQANDYIKDVYRFLKKFDTITLADLYNLRKIDYTGTDEVSRVIWTKETLLQKGALYPIYDSYKDLWYVKFPEPDQYPACETTYHITNQTPTPEPFNITILMDPTKDPYTTIREVIQQANKIKDRPVFITIN